MPTLSDTHRRRGGGRVDGRRRRRPPSTSACGSPAPRARRVVGVGEPLHPAGNVRAAATAVVIQVIGESTTGTADDAAAARDSGTALKSEQRMSNVPWLKTSRAPLERSVAVARISARGRGRDRRRWRCRTGFRRTAAPPARTGPSPSTTACPNWPAERPRDDLALHVALEEALLVLGEQPLAVEAVGERGEAAAGHAGDDVDRVQQAKRVAGRPDHLGAPEELQHAVRERGRARAAAGKGEDDQAVLAFLALTGVLGQRLARLEAIAGRRSIRVIGG